MQPNKTTLLLVVLMVGLFFTGFQFYGNFIEWFLIERNNISYEAPPTTGQFQHSLFFALNLAAVPLFALVLGKTGRQKMTALAFLSLCALAAILISRFLLFMTINKLPTVDWGNAVYPIPFDVSKINTALSLSLAAGCLTMVLYFNYQHRSSHARANKSVHNQR